MRRRLSTPDKLSLLMGILGILAFIFMWEVNLTFAKRLVSNESVVDILSAIFWLIASIICIYRIYRIKPNSQSTKFLLYFWAIFSFLCAGEELKWGYRLFHYHVTYLQDINSQHDISLHNLKLVHKWFIGPQHLFYLGFFSYFFVIPLLTFSDRIKSLMDKLHYITPGIYFMLATWIPILFSVLAVYAFTPHTPSNEYYRVLDVIAETREMFCAFIVLFYVYLYLPADFKSAPIVKPLGISESWKSWPKTERNTDNLETLKSINK